MSCCLLEDRAIKFVFFDSNGGGSFLSYSKRATHSPPWMAPGYQQQQWAEAGTTILICAFIASQFAFV